ncbi:cation efflux protein [Wolfiporia cocos MD-104 SS10]|uniref:Cation efflux protein n=1 Tax=Wolfiporia cocos (strain MD-104) TaxID=742152 RepID=A0A2H3IUW9_WOLCO|nr:cation efflux protein [Wolfiporia cocos MD-104 SS10]
MSRSTRIILLLVIDLIFFFVELIVGYAVGSLALVADSFHMLNDVMSLVVALYAIKLTKQTHTDVRYTYGWHRAEILAALINGVFLLALCFSISLEAIERFFSTPEISNPRLVVLVGSLGLASNIVGLFLFHEHGHDHGHSHGKESRTPSRPSSLRSNSETDAVPKATTTLQIPTSRTRSRSRSHSELYGHPAATRASIQQVAQEIVLARSPSPAGIRGRSPSHRSISRARHYEASELDNETVVAPSSFDTPSDERTPLLPSNVAPDNSDSHSQHSKHDHKTGGGAHGHSHGSMNMRALLLHVLGDALGNVGVIATGLVIWRSTWSWKYYFDPIISLVITVIIFSSALPLVKSTSTILLQGAPSTVSIEDVKKAILDCKGVISLHELHVWQLSETKIVASVHVKPKGDHDFMTVAADIRAALHHHGIHSSTIQPEYPRSPSGEYQWTTEETACLIVCPPDEECNPSENACCPPPAVEV